MLSAKRGKGGPSGVSLCDDIVMSVSVIHGVAIAVLKDDSGFLRQA